MWLCDEEEWGGESEQCLGQEEEDEDEQEEYGQLRQEMYGAK